jgi:hypothetical protein
VEKPEYVGLMRCDFKERVAGRGINLRRGPVALQYARRDAASHASPGLFGAECCASNKNTASMHQGRIGPCAVRDGALPG